LTLPHISSASGSYIYISRNAKSLEKKKTVVLCSFSCSHNRDIPVSYQYLHRNFSIPTIMLRPSPSIFVLATCVALGFCASLQAVASFGTNPTNIQMYIYVPDKLATKPAIIVAVSKTNQDSLRVSTTSHFPANFNHSCTPVVEPVRSGMLVPSSHHTPIRTALFSSTPVLPTSATAGMYRAWGA
jgi:hypothetical protein